MQSPHGGVGRHEARTSRCRRRTRRWRQRQKRRRSGYRAIWPAASRSGYSGGTRTHAAQHCALCTARLRLSPLQWWFESDEDENDGDIELEQPPTAWRIGELADGRAYTWRDSEDGDDDPEIKIWKEGELGSGDAYWFADDGMVSMTDPFDLTVVQRWIPGDGVPDDEDE